MNISCINTEIAFAYKSDKDLKNAQFLFRALQIPWLATIGTRITPFLMKTRMPVNGILRRTIFKQFVGGETLEATQPLLQTLDKYNVKVILDYGVEGKEGEEVFEYAADEFIRVINYASEQKNVPFISVKVTALARFALLETLNDAPRLRSGVHKHEIQNEEWNRVRERMYRICEVAAEKNIGILIDAEESWIQDPVDRLVMELMEEFNKERVVVYNTIQLYRHDRLNFLKMSYGIAQKKGFLYGIKLVRGAYMEKERLRAAQKGYASPIQPNKEATDKDFDLAADFCIEHIDTIGLVVATHNEQSNLHAISLLQNKGLSLSHPHVHLSQLYGMSDDITFNLAKAGVSISKYVPFGPIRDVIPYLMRRAEENSSMSGQSGRELELINREIARRKTISK